jgi:hypothetical protein
MIVGTLSWYMESPAFLERCIRSLAGIVDGLIAVDGRWQHFNDGGPVLSSDQEVEAIESAAKEIGIDLLLVRRKEVWKDQVAKRAFMCEATMALGADWMMVIDGDEYVAQAESGLRDALAETDKLVAEVGCLTTTASVQGTNAIRRIYSTAHGLTVYHWHNGYRTLDGRWLQGNGAFVPLEPTVDLSAQILLHHEHFNRSPERNDLATAYRRARRELQLEPMAVTA